MRTYVMDFNNRVTIPSSKNFQLINPVGEIVMQFGRVGKNTFTMDFKVLLGFAKPYLVTTIAISSIFYIPHSLSIMTFF